MQKLLNPKWLFLVNTLPLAVLFLLFLGQFNIIKTLLDEETLWYWKTFGFFTISALVFIFFIVRTIFIFFSKKGHIWKGQLALKIFIAIIFPLFGLAVNNGDITIVEDISLMIGDFRNSWFYILALINGISIGSFWIINLFQKQKATIHLFTQR